MPYHQQNKKHGIIVCLAILSTSQNCIVRWLDILNLTWSCVLQGRSSHTRHSEVKTLKSLLRMRYSSQPRVATVTRCPAFNYEPFMTYTNFPACNLKLEILSSISMKQTFLICSRLSFPLLELSVCLNY